MTSTADDNIEAFEALRPALLAHAYRMLGDLARAEDMVQEAWLRWSARQVNVETPRAYRVTIVTRLCLNELDSARNRREETRGNRLPEPIGVDAGGIGRVEMSDRVSMAFLVVVQRLTPPERAVLLLRDVFDFEYGEIAALVNKSEAACRKMLERARQHVAEEKRLFTTSPAEHRRLLMAFIEATASGRIDALAALLASDAVLVTDGGAQGRQVAGIRNLREPLSGAQQIAAFILATSSSIELEREIREINGQPGIVLYHRNAPFAVVLLAVADGKVHRVFFHGDLERLRFLGPRTATP